MTFHGLQLNRMLIEPTGINIKEQCEPYHITASALKLNNRQNKTLADHFLQFYSTIIAKEMFNDHKYKVSNPFIIAT